MRLRIARIRRIFILGISIRLLYDIMGLVRVGAVDGYGCGGKRQGTTGNEWI
jgi:hypothetical protein